MSLNLVHRNKKEIDIHEGKWNGLGGKFEAGETPEECVIREVLEESGLVIQNPRLHGLLVFTNFKGNDTSLNLWESDHNFFPWIVEGKFFSAKFEYEGDAMRAYDEVFHS